MPAQSQQQQKLFGLALAFKRGEVKSSEVSDEIKGIADRMSEKEIEDFAATKRKGLPKMKEQLRKIVREIMKEKAISEMNEESVNEAASKEAMGIAGFTGTRGIAVQKFIDDYNLDSKKLFNFVKKGKLKDRLAFVTAIAGKPGNKYQGDIVGMFGESVINEGYSTEEKRIVMMAVRKLSKYRNVPIDQSINDLLGAGAELQRDIKKGKIKK
jgi:hypothetical protein